MYHCQSADLLKEFYRDFSNLNSNVMQVFPNQVVIFGTELKIIEEFTT
jgi:hypothetical protein